MKSVEMPSVLATGNKCARKRAKIPRNKRPSESSSQGGALHGSVKTPSESCSLAMAAPGGLM